MWNQLITLAKAPEFADEDMTRRARALNSAHINMGGAVLILGILGVLFVFPEKTITSLILILCFGVIALSMMFNRRGQVRLSGVILLVFFWLITIFMVVFSGGLQSIDIIFFVSGTVTAGIILGVRGSLIYAALSLVAGLGFVWAHNLGVSFPRLFTIPPISAWLILFINLLFTIVPLQVALQALAQTAKRALASEERYRLIASVMSDYAFSVQYTPTGAIKEQWLGGAFEVITGYTPEEYFARGGWKSIVHPEDQGIDDQDMMRLRANQKVATQLRIIRKDGTVCWVRSYGHPKWDEENDRLIGLYGAVQDVSGQREIEINLRQREAILEVVAGAANTFLKIPEWSPHIWGGQINYLLEQLGTIMKASHAYMFEQHPLADGSPGLSMRYEWTAPGYDSDLGNTAYVNIPADLSKHGDDFRSWNYHMLAGLPYVGDARHISPQEMANLNARDIYALLDVPIYIDGRWWGIIGFDDMTRPREWSNAEVDALILAANLVGATVKRQQLDSMLQEELQQRKSLIDELEARNAELDRFNYTVSHDLKTPLVTIKGFLGFLEKDAAAGNIERLKEDTQRIANAVDKMNTLLHDLLELSRIGRVSYTPEAVSLTELIHEALELTHGRLKQRNVSVQIEPDLPIVFGDRIRLIEIWQNLLDNAAKYMGDQPAPQVEIGQCGRENELAIFYMRDNGIGIPGEYYDRIFGLFNKLDALSEGTGVGLTLVKRIVEVHGGRIWVESTIGQGSTFYLTLPIKE